MGARLNNDIGEKLLEAAAKLVCERGAGGLSICEAAKACGVSKGTLYYYYKTKDDMLSALAGRFSAALDERLFSWMDSLSPETGIGEAHSSLAAALFAGPELRGVAALLSGEYCPAVESCRTALTGWRILFELSAQRLSQEAGKKLEADSARILPAALGLTLTYDTDEERAEALYALLGD